MSLFSNAWILKVALAQASLPCQVCLQAHHSISGLQNRDRIRYWIHVQFLRIKVFKPLIWDHCLSSPSRVYSFMFTFPGGKSDLHADCPGGNSRLLLRGQGGGAQCFSCRLSVSVALERKRFSWTSSWMLSSWDILFICFLKSLSVLVDSPCRPTF